MFDIEDDLDGMFDTDDLAEVATFTIPDPDDPEADPVPTREVNVIYETAEGAAGIYDRSFFDEKFYSLIIDTQKAFFLCKTSDCDGIKRNTPVSFRSAQYYVFKAPLSDGFGVSIMFISKDQA